MHARWSLSSLFVCYVIYTMWFYVYIWCPESDLLQLRPSFPTATTTIDRYQIVFVCVCLYGYCHQWNKFNHLLARCYWSFFVDFQCCFRMLAAHCSDSSANQQQLCDLFVHLIEIKNGGDGYRSISTLNRYTPASCQRQLFQATSKLFVCAHRLTLTT